MDFFTELLVLIVLLCITGLIHGQNLSDVYKLRNDILSSYDKDVVPATDQSQPLTIETRFYLVNIALFEEISETISIIAAIELKWKDGGISWQPSNYGNKRRLKLKQGNIWTPPIMLLNSIDDLRPFEGDNEFMATLQWNGTVAWGPGGVLNAKLIGISALHHRDKSREMNAVWIFIGTRLPWIRKSKIKPLQTDKNTSRALPNIQPKPKSNIAPPDIRPLYEEKENNRPKESWTDMADRLFTKETTEMQTKSAEKQLRDTVSWQDVVDGMDVLCMIVSYVTMILVIFIFFVIIAS
ncbi:unnamed protein product [Mytilus edulis]|uniref:Neurotransmitter-gated ion-channel ligand-binding domain-containing protein n=1 Tax=Mytilus edulis TaxID=6550 RepID=A0A8S3S6M2_MYTED|nr:unnamed protein product [Mytilus edulis]